MKNLIKISEQKNRYATGTKQWLSSTPQLLVFSSLATRRIQGYIGWLRDDFPDNRNEQGGLLIGKYIFDDEGNAVQAEVLDVLLACTDCRFPGYIEWSAMEEIRLQRLFFQMKEELERIDPKEAEELKIIGWWHTHPNNLPVWMSETDMETQRLKYFEQNKYSVVLNPHRGIWRAFAGKNAHEVPSVMLLGKERRQEATEDEETSKDSRRCKQQKKRSNKRPSRKCLRRLRRERCERIV